MREYERLVPRLEPRRRPQRLADRRHDGRGHQPLHVAGARGPAAAPRARAGRPAAGEPSSPREPGDDAAPARAQRAAARLVARRASPGACESLAAAGSAASCAPAVARVDPGASLLIPRSRESRLAASPVATQAESADGSDSRRGAVLLALLAALVGAYLLVPPLRSAQALGLSRFWPKRGLPPR